MSFETRLTNEGVTAEVDAQLDALEERIQNLGLHPKSAAAMTAALATRTSLLAARTVLISDYVRNFLNSSNDIEIQATEHYLQSLRNREFEVQKQLNSLGFQPKDHPGHARRLVLQAQLASLRATIDGISVPLLAVSDLTGFVPTDEDITGWFDLGGGTIETGYSVVPDVINAIDATQPDVAQQPDAATRNGFAAMYVDSDDSANDHLFFPAHASNNSTTRWGWAGWVQPDSTSGQRTLVAHISGTGTSLSRIFVQASSSDLICNVNESNTVIRGATLTGALTKNPTFLGVGFSGDAFATDESRFKIFLDGVEQHVQFTDISGTPGVMPATIQAANGNGSYFSQNVTTGLRRALEVRFAHDVPVVLRGVVFLARAYRVPFDDHVRIDAVGLNRAAARRVVARSSDLERSTVTYRDDGLYRAFTKTLRAHDDRTLVVLKCAGDNFRGGSRPTINKHHERRAIQQIARGSG